MLQQSSLGEIVEKGESQTVEFKKSISLQPFELKALCAMVNSDLARGTAVFGIEKDRTMCGIEQGNLKNPSDRNKKSAQFVAV